MTICDHLVADSEPLDHRLILDAHLGVADSISACRHCGRFYLLELLDLLPDRRLFRLSPLPSDTALGLIKDVTRGSCDLQRAHNEVHHVKTATAYSPWLLEFDGAVRRLLAIHHTDTADLPTRSFRTLACDGAWFAAL